ncbi:MAG: S8 family serine peptidase [Anaerolineae bacterium]|nr:S8 family serine peptidase [Anaerolineae bacterium]
MKKLLPVILLCSLLLSVGHTPVDARSDLPDPLPAGVLEPELARALAETPPDAMVRVIVEMREQADPQALTGGARSVDEARARLVAGLQSRAAASQAALRAYLDRGRAAGEVAAYTPFWIVNAVAVQAHPSAVRHLADLSGVAVVRLDHYRQWIPTSFQPAISNLQSANLQPANLQPAEWNIARVHAPQVWSSLNVSGTGTVVAGMDTGVDWLHPALQTNYRGYTPHGLVNHDGNWFDAVSGSLYPVDGYGHGTHTLGTAVGQGGIGVAPGAQWIAARVFNSSGGAYDSWIHAGFEWLLAPGGDPSHAPDVVNCSWGSSYSFLTTFQPDLQALRTAGILPVFSNGNSGPGEETVGSPASLPEAFAVGAIDSYDLVASFSSRGPSPWGEIRPHVVAPGVGVLSSYPGGVYVTANGTSMAAPHVTGIAALLHSVDPTLSIEQMAALMIGTAEPLGDPVPNNDAGWGIVDAFEAVARLTHPGFITGTVRQQGSGAPIPGATVAAVAHGGPGSGSTTTDAAGAYLLALKPSVYDVTASAFGHSPHTVFGVTVTTNTVAAVNVSLTPLPSGALRATAFDAETGEPVTATLSVLDTPLSADAAAYTFTLPAGAYVLQARALGYRVVTATVTVAANEVATAALALPSAPTLLLVDSGGWYYGSEIGYYRQALDDLALAYDEWPILALPGYLPAAADLLPYDVVVWSAPRDAPAFIGAEEAIVEYLSAGGRLFLSGQDIGFLDGGMQFADYYPQYLKATWVDDSSGIWTLTGAPGDLFEGITVDIAGTGGADNQLYPDEIAVIEPDYAAPVFYYQDDGCGGIRVGTCLDYRTIYLSFGFEAMADRAARSVVLARSLDWLVAPLPDAGLELSPQTQAAIGLPGTVVTHTVRVRHVGEGGLTDTVTLSLSGVEWPTEIETTELTLGACTSSTVRVTVTIPAGAGWDARDAITLTAQSTLSPTLNEAALLLSKAPAPVLLVDDDRWYEQVEKYHAALSAAEIPYDDWQVCPALGACQDNSPPLDVLQRYPIVVWWTGYDWYRPVTAAEAETLEAYLAGGGRLLFSGQDFLYYHYEDALAQEFFGVLTYTEGVTSTLAHGVPQHPISSGMGPWALDFPYLNWSDGVAPTPGTAVVFRDQNRAGIALARRSGDYATAFFAFPFETLPEPVRPAVAASTVGWLSWLGGSTFAADREVVSSGGVVTYTAALRNDGPEPVTASFSNTLPLTLTLAPGSLTGPATYDGPSRRVAWTGAVGPGAPVTITYRVTAAGGLAVGTPIANPARIGLEDHHIRFDRAAVVRIGTPDLAPSMLWVSPPAGLPGTAVTGTLALVNVGLSDALTATAVHLLPAGLEVISGSLRWEGGGAAAAVTGTVVWSGTLGVGAGVTLSYQMTLPTALAPRPLYGVAFLEDGAGGAWERATWAWVEPAWVFLPVIVRY